MIYTLTIVKKENNKPVWTKQLIARNYVEFVKLADSWTPYPINIPVIRNKYNRYKYYQVINVIK